MNDGQRVYPVDYHFLHHSTGPKFVNAEDIEVQDWYSATGKARGYSNGAVNSNHEHPSRPGQQTYAMAQFTLREYNKDGNKYGWRLTDLIARPWGNVAWAVGNWFYNTRSTSTEVCGNYLNETLPDKALMCLADFLRGIDQELIAGGYPGGINVWLHQEVFATACPGNIKNQRDTIVDMINNPAKWNAILWPVTPPAPVITTKDVVETTEVPFSYESLNDPQLPKGEIRIKVAGVKGVITTTTRITYTNGVMTSSEVINTTQVPPVTEVTLVGTYVEPVPNPEPVPTESLWDIIKAAILKLIEWLKTFKKEK